MVTVGQCPKRLLAADASCVHAEARRRFGKVATPDPTKSPRRKPVGCRDPLRNTPALQTHDWQTGRNVKCPDGEIGRAHV